MAVCITILAFASSLHARSTNDMLMDHTKMDHSAHVKIIADAQAAKRVF